MHVRRSVLTLAAAAVVAVAPLSVASAHTTHHGHHHKFAVNGVHVVGHQHVFNVADAPANVVLEVKLRDRSGAPAPTSVTLTIREKIKGQAATTFDVAATETNTKTVPDKTWTDKHGKTHTIKGFVVTTWDATVTVAQGAVDPGTKALFGVAKVTVDPDTSTTKNVHLKAGHHHHCFGRSTFIVINKPAVTG